MMMKKQKKFYLNSLALLGFLGLCAAIAYIGSLATQKGLYPWYAELPKASWAPPAWVFPPVWTVLYTLIAISGWLIYKQPKSKERDKALLFYFTQLFFNAIWSIIFFYFQQPIMALLDLCLIIVFLELTMKESWHVSKPATVLLIPYALWSVYALSLNGAIVYFLK
jgi:benzodiazapine receptor